ncbi:MAG: cytochrome c bioproteinis factor [Bacteroidetes bacterium]|nr:MAG: cytochrome c bioproteinis factor [Bacteroidota bacterium]
MNPHITRRLVYRLLPGLVFGIAVTALLRCGPETKTGDPVDPETKKYTYLNHQDTVRYVGANVCRNCHPAVYETFMQTGMGQSFGMATKEKSKANFDGHALVYDKFSDFWYRPFWRNDSMFILEFRKEGNDTVYKRTEHVDYIVGSGQHTNSHIRNTNGFLHQMPLTFYTQQGKWDLPPGFENGFNTRFSRKIGLECMSCHNSLPGFEAGSENKFTAVPGGIGCERCHGPGSLHVWEKTNGHLIDTSRFIDYTIVNPGKLSFERQFDVCQRCHLQGNAVLKEGKSFFDFRPGMVLSDYMTVFMPKYEGREDEFIMASHAERMKMSPCFIKTNAGVKFDENDLRPYKKAMTCVTCHDPHVSVKATGQEVFNASCMKCHNGTGTKGKCTDTDAHLKAKDNNCVSCHMPRSGSIDIPHVTVTDHFIRKPVDAGKVREEVKKFIGLYAVNEKNPSAELKAKAYILQCEKFAPGDLYLLDSAKHYLRDDSKDAVRKNFSSLVQLYYLKGDYNRIMNYVQQLGQAEVLNKMLVKKSWSNDDAWTAYRIGEAFFGKGENTPATAFHKKASELAPHVPDFKSKYGLALASSGRQKEAMDTYQQVLDEHPEFVPALTNLGYLYLVNGDAAKARRFYEKALALDPDYEPLLLNMAGLLAFERDFKGAEKIIDHLLKRNPKNEKALQVKKQLKEAAKGSKTAS